MLFTLKNITVHTFRMHVCGRARMVHVCSTEDNFAEFCLSAPLCALWGSDSGHQPHTGSSFRSAELSVEPQVMFGLLWAKVVGS